MKTYTIIKKGTKDLFWDGEKFIKGFVTVRVKNGKKKTLFKGKIFDEKDIIKTPLPINGLWVETEQAEYIYEKSVFDDMVEKLQSKRKEDEKSLFDKLKQYSLKPYKELDNMVQQ